MRPLLHPSMDDVTVEGLLHALSDPLRVAIFAEVASIGCGKSCTSLAAVREQAIPKSTLSQHFKILRESGLIRGERKGVEMQHTARCAEIDAKFPGLLAAVLEAYRTQAKKR